MRVRSPRVEILIDRLLKRKSSAATSSQSREHLRNSALPNNQHILLPSDARPLSCVLTILLFLGPDPVNVLRRPYASDVPNWKDVVQCVRVLDF